VITMKSSSSIDLTIEKELATDIAQETKLLDQEAKVADLTQGPLIEECEQQSKKNKQEGQKQSVKDFLYKDVFLEGFIWE